MFNRVFSVRWIIVFPNGRVLESSSRVHARNYTAARDLVVKLVSKKHGLIPYIGYILEFQ